MNGGITALPLYADASRLATNLFFTLLQHSPQPRTQFKPGLLWIMTTGNLGNYLNSLVHATDHLSIDTSAVIFAASDSLSGLCISRTRPFSLHQPLIHLITGLTFLTFLDNGGESNNGAERATQGPSL
ncbi:hypothetical protein DSUL_20175 [Desulfovibrionales bacterium]